MDAETKLELAQMREEIRALSADRAALAREVAMLKAEAAAKFNGENDPGEINRKLRALAVSATGSADAGGVASGGAGGGGGDTGPASWDAKTPAQKVETIKQGLCGASIVCNGDGTITLTIPGLSC